MTLLRAVYVTSAFLSIGVVALTPELASAQEARPDTACKAMSPGTSETRVIRERLLEQWAKHDAALRAGDATRATMMMADDVLMIGRTGGPATGRATIEKALADDLKTGRPTQTVRCILELRVFDDAAYEIGTSNYRFERVGGTISEGRAHYMVAWRRQQDGSWQITRFVSEWRH